MQQMLEGLPLLQFHPKIVFFCFVFLVCQYVGISYGNSFAVCCCVGGVWLFVRLICVKKYKTMLSLGVIIPIGNAQLEKNIQAQQENL